MTTILQAPEKPIAACESKLLLLWDEVKDTPVGPRVQMWVERMCAGRKLSEFLRDTTLPVRERLTVAQRLTDILSGKNYDSLPRITIVSSPPKSPEMPPPPAPAPDHLRAIIRQEVHQEMATLLEKIAKSLRESK